VQQIDPELYSQPGWKQNHNLISVDHIHVRDVAMGLSTSPLVRFGLLDGVAPKNQ
jgi:hypothetical protein